MSDAAFDRAQAAYDSAEPSEREPAIPAVDILEGLIHILGGAWDVFESSEVSSRDDGHATVTVHVAGYAYAFTLNRED